MGQPYSRKIYNLNQTWQKHLRWEQKCESSQRRIVGFMGKLV
jgi:hypothetical protein